MTNNQESEPTPMTQNDRSTRSNRFEFVTLAGARARQLLKGCTPRVDGRGKTARIAQKEVLSGAVQRVRDDVSAE